jgi:hypothetical protein
MKNLEGQTRSPVLSRLKHFEQRTYRNGCMEKPTHNGLFPILWIQDEITVVILKMTVFWDESP